MGTSQLHFEVLLEFANSSMRDINYCAFIRSPIIKQASFCMVEVFMSQILARQLQSDLSRNKYADIKVIIYVDDQAEKDKIQNIYKKTLRCLDMKTDKNIQFTDDRIHVTLLLVHPILHYLGNNNTFNRIFLNTTSSSVLGTYEGFLTSEFGDIFLFNHIGDDVQKNSFTYRQLLTKSPNDLSIPDYLIQNYKVNNSFCYYFYDIFHISDNSTNEICCNYINLHDNKQFKQINVGKYIDKQLTVDHIDGRTFSDMHHKFIDKKGTRYILREPDIRAEYEKEPKKTSLDKKNKPTEQEFELVDGRKVKVQIEKNLTSHNYSGSSALNEIYCPDNIKNGRKRYDNAIELLKEKLLQIEIYELSNCLPDFIQFDQIYNLEDHNETNYNYVPISIVNIFARKVYREQYLYHLAKTTMLRYKNQ